jgi:hypothetical protein
MSLRKFTTCYRGQNYAFQQAFVTVGHSLATTRKGGQEAINMDWSGCIGGVFDPET